ncbi:hypothetical protein [Benzoatithermus flavus]|uniref:Uncharacterized protein n=1 Tax=Benzoatithermus flavus TaxID=3108223 RepID=A0ABU8XKT5_9PROT
MATARRSMQRPEARPPQPLLVLAVAIVLPGCGHLLLGLQQRAMMFLFFIVLLGLVTYHLTTPEHSFLGRYAGGLFVYAISLTDAYKLARMRFERWRSGQAPAVPPR